MTRHFAVDLGAESGRCMVGTLDNGVITLEELSRFPTQVCEIRGELYWNVYRYYDEIVKGLRRYVERYGPELDSIGVDSWGVDYCLLDCRGELQGLPKSYRRMDTTEPYAVMEEKFGKEKIYEHNGIQFLNFNTLNQVIYEKGKDPRYMEDAAAMMFVGDALHYLLGADAACEYSAASISQLVDTHARRWDDEIFEAFSIPKSVQTPIVFAGDPIGTLADSLADQVGLKHGVKIVTPAVHDTASASVAVPADGEGWASISSGTWSLASMELDAPITNAESYRMNVSNSAGVLGKTLFLKNIMGLWIIQQCKYRWEKTHPGLTYSRIVELAEQAPAFAAFIDPDDDVFFTPGDMPARICTYLKEQGQEAPEPGDIGAVARIVYESLTLKYRMVFEAISGICGKPIRTLHITGGGSNNAMLNQFTANALGVPVVAGPTECSAMGNLLMQAYGCGAVGSLQEIRQVVKASSELQTFKPVDGAQWDAAYATFSKRYGR